MPLEQFTAIIRGHHLVLPSGVSLVIKTLIVLEGTARQLSPSFNLMELVGPYHDQLMSERLRPKHWLAKLRRTHRDVDRLLSDGPRDLTNLLDRLRSGQFEVKLEHRHLQAAINRLVAGLLAAALFLGSAQLYSQRIPPVAFGVSVPGCVWLHRRPCHGNTSLAEDWPGGCLRETSSGNIISMDIRPGGGALEVHHV